MTRLLAKGTAFLRSLRRDRSGTTAVEYAILIGMMAVVVIGIAALGGTLDDNFFSTFAGYF